MSIIVDCALSAQINNKGVHKMTEMEKLIEDYKKLNPENLKIVLDFVRQLVSQQELELSDDSQD